MSELQASVENLGWKFSPYCWCLYIYISNFIPLINHHCCPMNSTCFKVKMCWPPSNHNHFPCMAYLVAHPTSKVGYTPSYRWIKPTPTEVFSGYINLGSVGCHPHQPPGFLPSLHDSHAQRAPTRQCCEPGGHRPLHWGPPLHSAGPMRLPATGGADPLPSRGAAVLRG